MKNLYRLFLSKQVFQSLFTVIWRKQILSAFLIIVFLSYPVYDSHSKLNDKYKDGAMCIGGVSGVALGAAAIPEPVVSKAVALGAGAFQLGYFATGFIWNLFDPPDTINACVPVSLSTYLVYNYPDILTQAPQCDPILASHLDVCMDYADTLVALSRAILAANDRYQGALLIKNLPCALARRSELNDFINRFNQLRSFLQYCWVPVFNRIHIIWPSYGGTPIPMSLMQQMRDSVSAGIFPAEEIVAMNAWQITPNEASMLSSFMGSLSDSMITVFYDSYSPGSTSVPLEWCFNEAMTCATDFDITPVTSSVVYDFNAQSSGTSNTLYSVSTVSQSVAWAGGVNATVRRTTNGGATWTNAAGTGITGHVYYINAISSTTAFCTTTPSTSTFIYKTTNGGTTWQTVYSQSGGFIDAIEMISPTTGYALGDPVGGKWTILRTTNSGNNWTRILTEPNQSGGELGWNSSFHIIGNHMWFGTNANRIYHSTNLGLTWTSTSSTGTTNSYSLHFNDVKNGIAGGDGVSYSNDSSKSFSVMSMPTGLSEVYGIDGLGKEWWCVGNGARIYKSGDNGLNWSTVHTQPGAILFAIDFSNTGNLITGWSVGSLGTIVKMSTTILDASLNLTSLIEGFYNGSTQIPDTMRVYLANVTSPYAIVDSAKTLMSSSGNGLLSFLNTPAGSYYVVCKHRNSLETWSGGGVPMAPSNVTNYDFTTAGSQAYGNNMKLKSGKWCIYGGDVNRDGAIDLSDIVRVYNDAVLFLSGYEISDLNGDNTVDLTDIIIAFNNSNSFITLIRP